jgi:hypothetical protein
VADVARQAGMVSNLLTVRNRHIETECIDLDSEGRIDMRVAGIPIAISVVSTAEHWYTRIDSNTKRTLVSTRYKGIPEGKFIYSNIPLILLEGPGRQPNIATEGTLSLQAPATAPDSEVLSFDGFEECAGEQRPTNRLQLAGILVMEEAR